MKFLINLLFIGQTMAATPIHIYYENESSHAAIIKNILTEKYSVPHELIDLVSTLKCEGVRSQGKFDMCLKNNGDLYVVSVDQSFVNESLKIFSAP